MKKYIFSGFFIVCAIILVVLRCYLVLNVIEPYTGFYRPDGNSLGNIFSGSLLGLCIAVAALSTILFGRQTESHNFNYQRKTLGIAMFVYSLLLMIRSMFLIITMLSRLGDPYFLSENLWSVLFIAFSALAAIALAYNSVSVSVRGNATAPNFSLMLVILWQGWALVKDFLQMDNAKNISNQWLIIVYQAAAFLFFYTFARQVSGTWNNKLLPIAVSASCFAALTSLLVSVPALIALVNYNAEPTVVIYYIFIFSTAPLALINLWCLIVTRVPAPLPPQQEQPAPQPNAEAAQA